MSMSITSNYGNYGYYNNFIKENESGSVQAESKKPIQAPIAGVLPTQSTGTEGHFGRRILWRKADITETI